MQITDKKCAELILRKLKYYRVSPAVFRKIEEVGGVLHVDWDVVPLPAPLERYVSGLLFLRELERDLDECENSDK